MLVKIAIVVSLCSSVNMDRARQKMVELQKQNPGAQVTIRLDKKCLQPAAQTFTDQ